MHCIAFLGTIGEERLPEATQMNVDYSNTNNNNNYSNNSNSNNQYRDPFQQQQQQGQGYHNSLHTTSVVDTSIGSDSFEEFDQDQEHNAPAQSRSR